MRFKRQERYGPRQLTDRQRAAYARKLVREQARYPLFSQHVASEQRSIDEEAERRQQQSVGAEQRQREFIAKVWRGARALYFSQPDNVRAMISAKWKEWTGPCTALYFSALVDVESGEQALRLARINAERAPARERILRQIKAAQSDTLDLE